jgi:hypothetical protein
MPSCISYLQTFRLFIVASFNYCRTLFVTSILGRRRRRGRGRRRGRAHRRGTSSGRQCPGKLVFLPRSTLNCSCCTYLVASWRSIVLVLICCIYISCCKLEFNCSCNLLYLHILLQVGVQLFLPLFAFNRSCLHHSFSTK